MSTRGRNVPQAYGAAGRGSEVHTGGGAQQRRGDWQPNAHQAAGAGPQDGARRRRRRQRTQRGKRPRGTESRAPRPDTVSREHIFQELEGLLRQIREQAEEVGGWPEERLTPLVQAVTGFTRSLDEQSDPISERTRDEYKRIREKLSQALRAIHE